MAGGLASIKPRVLPEDPLCAARSRSRPIRENQLDKAGNPVGRKSLIADFVLSGLLPSRCVPQSLPFLTVIPSAASRCFFSPPRSCEAVGLRAEESLFVCAFSFFTSMPATQRERKQHERKKAEKRERRGELRREYDLSKLKGGVRVKYLARYRAGTHLVLLSPDVAEYFSDEQTLNAALRTLIHAAKRLLRPSR